LVPVKKWFWLNKTPPSASLPYVTSPRYDENHRNPESVAPKTMIQALTNRRSVTAEIMDSPGIDQRDHLEALEGLRRINRFSRTVDQMLSPIVAYARQAGLTRMTLLDVACGGGDVPIGLAKQALQLGIQIDLILLDQSPTALRQATAAADDAGLVCQTIQASALTPLPLPEADMITSSLFLHHVPSSNEVIALMGEIRQAAKRMVVISDLRRSRRGFAAAWLGCRLLSRSPIVHHDGPASVRAAWTLEELSSFAAQAGMKRARINPCWPCRMILAWEKTVGIP
jgi:2-polyprenyl-3-methyl-5-hydroxy-6-metoxy-1,4-benzoquinol methylase